jgi:hypothetical protein
MTDSTNKIRREDRLKELRELLARRDKMSTAELKVLLYEIRHNFAVLLAMRSVEGSKKDMIAFLAAVERTHYLLDTIEGRPSQRIAIDHKVQTSKLDEIRNIITDPHNFQDVLQLEGMILDKFIKPNA